MMLMANAVLNVKGMKCGGCETNVSETVKAFAGVQSVKASHKEARVEIEFDDTQSDLDAIKKAITGKGFEVT
jgi:copper chaperone